MIALLLLSLFSTLFILSFLKIRKDLKIEFIYSWGFPFGSFVWEDLFVFSLYGLISTIIAIATNQTRIGILLLTIFWIVRSFGEMIYYFLQQFIVPKHHPHDIESHTSFINLIFGPISHQQKLILFQVTCQIVLMFSPTALILLLLSWDTLS